MIKINNPYSEVNWDRAIYIDSMSHQHSVGDTQECQAFYEMGYRHFAFSNYYPSLPVESLPDEFAREHPDVIFTPNAEHHSFIDTGLHCNGLGSYFASGYGSPVSPNQLEESPLIGRFKNLHPATGNEDKNEGRSIYRLDIIIEAKDAESASTPVATLSVEGAEKSTFGERFDLEGELKELPLDVGTHRVYLRVSEAEITATLKYDKEQFTVRQFRLMQGTNRPWREVFQDIFNELKYPDGGGITLNHPFAESEHYLPMLDADPRVLGVEVWNFRRGFGTPLHFYNVWNDLLRTGRRCWGFFVKDHRAFERGRNVLILPGRHESTSAEDCERAALRAYREGAFFGTVAAPSTSDANEVTEACDKTDFRFTRIEVQHNSEGLPLAVKVDVAGQDTDKRPNVQIRFVTAKGIELYVDDVTAELSLEMEPSQLLEHRFVRVEAFAYPDTHDGGKPLTPEIIRQMDVAQIASLQDEARVTANKKPGSSVSAPDGRTLTPWNSIGESIPTVYKSVPVVDMIFSQALQIEKSE